MIKERVVNKNVILASLSVVLIQTHAISVELKNGTIVNVPDKIIIHNDMHENALIEQKVNYFVPPGKPNVKTRHLESGEEIVLEVNRESTPSYYPENSLGVIMNKKKYHIFFATYYLPEAKEKIKKPSPEAYLTLAYKLSDIIARKKDAQGYTASSITH